MADDIVVPIDILGSRYYIVTAQGLDKLGLPELAAEQRAAARDRLRGGPRPEWFRVLVSGPTGIEREGKTVSRPSGLSGPVSILWPDGTSEYIERRHVAWLDDDAPAGAGDSVEADRG